MARIAPTRGHRLVVAVLFLLLSAAATLIYGRRILVAGSRMPERAEVLVVLAGSTEATRVRHGEALRLLAAGLADHVMLSVRRGFYWGEWLPDLVRRYLLQEYGPQLASKHVICEMTANSTGEEAHDLGRCLAQHGWNDVVVVTSDWHSRRATWIWQMLAKSSDPPLQVTVHGVPDGDLDATRWWRTRRSAKTWIMEFMKIIWFLVEGLPEAESRE